MENRTQKLPSEWEKRPLNMTGEPAQGPMKTSMPTSRDLAPGSSGNYTTDLISSRPGAIAQRALAPIPSEVVNVLQEAPGGFVAQHFAGAGSFDAERAQPGDDGNVAVGAKGGTEEAKGSATKVTGRPVSGQTSGKGTI